MVGSEVKPDLPRRREVFRSDTDAGARGALGTTAAPARLYQRKWLRGIGNVCSLPCRSNAQQIESRFPPHLPPLAPRSAQVHALVPTTRATSLVA